MLDRGALLLPDDAVQLSVWAPRVRQLTVHLVGSQRSEAMQRSNDDVYTMYRARAVRDGRRREFARFAWAEEIPDPQDAQTFERSRLDLALRDQGRHCALLCFYRDLIATRKRSAALYTCDKEHLDVRVVPDTDLLLIRRWQPEGEEVLIVAFFASDAVSERVPISAERWLKTVDASADIYGGSTGMPGLPSILEGNVSQQIPFTPFAFAIYRRDPKSENVSG